MLTSELVLVLACRLGDIQDLQRVEVFQRPFDTRNGKIDSAMLQFNKKRTLETIAESRIRRCVVTHEAQMVEGTDAMFQPGKVQWMMSCIPSRRNATIPTRPTFSATNLSPITFLEIQC
jgi:hypothetical protein